MSTNRKTAKTNKHKAEEKQLYAYFKQHTGEILNETLWKWIRKANLNRQIWNFLKQNKTTPWGLIK